MASRFAGFRARHRPPTSARVLPSPLSDFLQRYLDGGEASVAQPFRGVATDGRVVPDLFKIEKPGIRPSPSGTRPVAAKRTHRGHRESDANDPLRKSSEPSRRASHDRYSGNPARRSPSARFVQMLCGMNGNRARSLDAVSCGSISSTFFIVSAA